MPLQGVPTREEVSVPVEKGNLKRVRFHCVASARTESALERAESPACPIGRCRLEKDLVPPTKLPLDVKELSVCRYELAVVYAVDLLLLHHAYLCGATSLSLHSPQPK